MGCTLFTKLLDMFNELRPKQLLLLAGGAAALMFVIIYFAMTSLTKPEPQATPVAQVTTQQIIVAKTNIKPMDIIRQDMLERKELPLDQVPAGAITDSSQIVGFMAKASVLPGEAVTKDKLYGDTGQAGMVSIIPPDCRAISVKISDITGVAGFAKSGNRVDVVLVEHDKQQAVSTLLLQNVLLLGVNKASLSNQGSVSDQEKAQEEKGGEGDKKDDKDGKNGKNKKGGADESPSVATLALHPDEILKITSAAKLGEIYLVLRPAHPSNGYVAETDYNLFSDLEGNGSSSGGGDGGAEPASSRPVPAFQPPASPVTSAPAPVAGGGSAGGFEIIEGDKVGK